MQRPTGKPCVFVSSTIRDFADLRSALKYWLEEMGVEVQMSEFNDFERRPEQGTFDSCFDAITDCDYYVLLVGGRKGSSYPGGETSVTQQEYRVAMSLARQGLIKPVLFVRAAVKTALAERQAARGDPRSPHADSMTASGVLEDPDFVESFVGEIMKTELWVGASNGRPGSVWLYPFDNFRDVVAALRVNLRLHRSIRRQALLANLKWELEENIAALCTKKSGQPFYASDWLTKIRSEIQLTDETLERGVTLEYKDAVCLAIFWLFAPSPDRLRTMALQEAILSGEFLAYRQERGELVSSPAYSAMQVLLSKIEAQKSTMAFLRIRAQQQARLMRAVQERKPSAVVDGFDMAALYSLHDLLRDILALSVALGDYIRHPQTEFQMPQLSPITPIVSQIAGIQDERVTHEDIERWCMQGMFTDLSASVSS